MEDPARKATETTKGRQPALRATILKSRRPSGKRLEVMEEELIRLNALARRPADAHDFNVRTTIGSDRAFNG